MCLLPFPNYFHKDYISDYVVSEVADLLSWWSTSDLTEAPLNACSQKEVGGGRERKKGTKRERKKKQKKKKEKDFSPGLCSLALLYTTNPGHP